MIKFIHFLIISITCLQVYVNGFGLSLIVALIGRVLFLLRFRMFSLKNKYGYIIWELVSFGLTTLWRLVWKNFHFDFNFKILLLCYFVVILTEYLEVTLKRLVELTPEQYKMLTYQMDYDEDEDIEEDE